MEVLDDPDDEVLDELDVPVEDEPLEDSLPDELPVELLAEEELPEELEPLPDPERESVR
ncbi:hypothetical protein ACFQ80_14595 [Isoptericola sp. NPDC056578]|uniref:hypothetical protein n=1 Tax=Isoptericola sp. NPDC056578 TaxID=3345870 RepID=UPI0036A24A8B